MNGLFIIDMQNGFLETDAPIYVKDGILICEKIIKVLKFAREKDFKIFWTKVNIENFRNTQYEDLFPSHFSKNETVLSKGTHNYEITPELLKYLSDKDFIIEKNTYSAFINTNIESILKNNKIKNLYFTGVSTNVCVESTIRDAFQLGYYCTLISDCTKTFSDNYQKLSEEIVSFVFGNVIDSNKFLNLNF